MGPPQRGMIDAARSDGATDLLPPPADSAVDSTRPPADGAGPPPADAGVPPADAGSGAPCLAAAANACPAGSYCSAPNCVSGVCVVAASNDTLAPVCGCDQVTYWNASVAARRATGVRSPGACSPGLTCGGIASLNCPSRAVCNLEVPSAAACVTADLGGRCWELPTGGCPAVAAGVGPNTRRCNANQCADLCQLINAEQPFYVDNSCPQ
jgi:hypothetical protein